MDTDTYTEPTAVKPTPPPPPVSSRWKWRVIAGLVGLPFCYVALVTFVIPNFREAYWMSRVSGVKSDDWVVIAPALEAYKKHHGAYPTPHTPGLQSGSRQYSAESLSRLTTPVAYLGNWSRPFSDRFNDAKGIAGWYTYTNLTDPTIPKIGEDEKLAQHAYMLQSVGPTDKKHFFQDADGSVNIDKLKSALQQLAAEPIRPAADGEPVFLYDYCNNYSFDYWSRGNIIRTATGDKSYSKNKKPD